MQRQICYLMSGAAHLPYLVVSLYSLRQFWNGVVKVFAWEDSYDLAEEIAKDEKLNIEVGYREVTYRGKNAQFLDKIRLLQAQPPGTASVYFDADTMINLNGRNQADQIDLLLGYVEQFGFVSTQFNAWDTQGIVNKRVRRMVDRAIPQDVVHSLINERWPSVNGGIWGCVSGSPVAKQWEQWTEAILDVFIADETALHAIMATYIETEKLHLVTGGRFNCSPKHQQKELADEDVVVWHFHGDGNCRLNKSQKGVDLWWPVYRHCMTHNVGRMAEWKSRVKNKHLDRLERTYGETGKVIETDFYEGKL